MQTTIYFNNGKRKYSELYNGPNSYLYSDPHSHITDSDYSCDDDWKQRVEERYNGTARSAHVSKTPERMHDIVSRSFSCMTLAKLNSVT